MAPKQLKLWELAGDNADWSFSPFVWRVRFALAYKSLPYEYQAWRFNDRDLIAPCKTVPTLDYGDKRMNESMDICKYLDTEFPDTPKLFDTASGNVGIHFINHWCDTVFVPTMFSLVIMPIYKGLTPEDQKYFRESREAGLGQTLEKYAGDKAQQAKQREAVQECLTPLRQTLKSTKWLGGERINYADLSVAGTFMLARAAGVELLDKDDPVYEWRERIFKEFEETINKNGKYRETRIET
ncbi:hypothetical protein ABBQ32_004278 [Trebouxia sp. C0010 RCD-2024]